jgi:tetratricopeptide (TPR) repeat protein
MSVVFCGKAQNEMSTEPLSEQQNEDMAVQYTRANQDITSIMDSAAAAYSEGVFGTALEEYRFIIDSLGKESVALYYNMGNAAFKRNDLAAAILFYEKALKLEPNDEDILFNLGLANSRIPDKIEAVPEVFLVKWYKEIAHWITPDQWAWTTIILLGLALILLALYFISYNIAIRKTGFWLGIILLIVCIFSFTVSFQTTQNLKEHNTAIVFSASVTVKSSPEKSSTEIFVLHEGSKVWILETVNDWYKIKIANGSVGWIQKEDLELI